MPTTRGGPRHEGHSHRGLAVTLEAQLTESDSGQFEVGEQRERNHRYYALQPIGNEIRGKSHYISPDVLDSVENKKALFKETFLTGRSVVKFKPVSNAPLEADAKTAYVEWMLQKNCKEALFRDGWHDAFVAKRMVVMAEWENDTRTIDMDIQGATQQQVMMLIYQQMQQNQIVSLDESRMQNMGNGIFAGTLGIEVDDSYTKLTLCQPERYYRDPNATYPDDAAWNTYEEDLGRGELITRGYDEDQVYHLNLDYRFRSEEEDSSRKAHDRSWTRRRQHKRTQEQETVTFYRTWTWLDMLDHDVDIAEALGITDNTPRLYEIHWSSGQILYWADGTIAVREVECQPFFDWCEFKISHAEHGMADADITAHTQKHQSILKRGVLDNTQMINTTRYEAQLGMIKNPRDLLDNRIGGVVWSRRIGSVAPLAQSPLSPNTMSAIAMMQADGDKRSGISDLAKGMNQDAIRYQNAEGMIDKLTTAGNRRVMGAARDWAQTFLVPLARYIVRLGMDNDKGQKQLEVGGRIIPVVPSQWTDTELNMAVAKALTPEEGQRMGQSLLMLHQVMSQDPQLAQLYGVAQKHALMDDVFDSLGVDDTTRYMMRPDTPEFAAMQQQQQQQMMQEQQKQDFLVGEQLELAKSMDRREWEKFEWDRTNDLADNLREDRELDHTIDKDEKELEIEEEQGRAVNVG